MHNHSISIRILSIAKSRIILRSSYSEQHQHRKKSPIIRPSSLFSGSRG